MLPQKKNLLRRNAWYRQQLLQLVASYPSSAVDTDRKNNIDVNNRNSPTTANKP